MRVLLRVLPFVALAVVVPSAAALAAPPVPPPTLTATPLLVHAGDTVTVTGDACPFGHTVTQVLQQTLGPNFAKGVPPFVPLDLGTIGLSDTPSGVSFHVVADTPRRTLNFQLVCSDGTTATSATPVTVQPPTGELWWTYNSYDQFVTERGAHLWFTARTWDCPQGSTATASIVNSAGATVIGPLTTTVAANGVVEFGIDLPTTVAGGTYTGTISCSGQAGAVSGSTPITIVGDGSVVPATGTTGLLFFIAIGLIVVGLVLRVTARRRVR